MNAKQFSDDLRGDIESLLSNSLENHELGPKIELESETRVSSRPCRIINEQAATTSVTQFCQIYQFEAEMD